MNVQQWMESFVQAEKNKSFTLEDEESAVDWKCCSVGSRLQIENPDFLLSHGDSLNTFPENYLTPTAQRLGLQFFEQVKANEIRDAKKTFLKIQALPRVLKKEYAENE